MVIRCKSQVLLHGSSARVAFFHRVQADTPLPAAFVLVPRKAMIHPDRSYVTRSPVLGCISYAQALRVGQILVDLIQDAFRYAQKFCVKIQHRPFFHHLVKRDTAECGHQEAETVIFATEDGTKS